MAGIGLALTERPVFEHRAVVSGVTREELAKRGPWLADVCKEQGFRYCPRLHIELYGNQRGT